MMLVDKESAFLRASVVGLLFINSTSLFRLSGYLKGVEFQYHWDTKQALRTSYSAIQSAIKSQENKYHVLLHGRLDVY